MIDLTLRTWNLNLFLEQKIELKMQLRFNSLELIWLGIFFFQTNKSFGLSFSLVLSIEHFGRVIYASAEVFLMALKIFLSRRERCSVTHYNKGSNFVGTANCLKRLNWNRIQKDGAISSIEWKLNPSTAALWGRWWKRLTRLMEDLLKKST